MEGLMTLARFGAQRLSNSQQGEGHVCSSNIRTSFLQAAEQTVPSLTDETIFSFLSDSEKQSAGRSDEHTKRQKSDDRLSPPKCLVVSSESASRTSPGVTQFTPAVTNKRRSPPHIMMLRSYFWLILRIGIQLPRYRPRTTQAQRFPSAPGTDLYKQ